MRYFIGFLVTIGLIVLIIVLLLGGRGGNTPATKALNLADYTKTNSAAELIIDGPVVADQTHRAAKIVVDQNQVTATFYSGYQGSVIRSQAYANNTDAYAVFLRALQHSGFTLYDSKAPKDERGYCPQGLRYILRFTSDGDELRRSWTTTCGSTAPRSFLGQSQIILNLFKVQVPDYNSLTQGTTQF